MSATGARLEPRAEKGPVRHDPRLDGLRGFAAVSVMAVHVWLNPGKSGVAIKVPSEYLLTLQMAHMAVMLFFITSGYVIGLTNTSAFSAEGAWEYLRRRTLRIVPVYYIALFLAWLAYMATPPLIALANVLFLQNEGFHIIPMPGDLPVWSLHYEVVYYLGFLLVWAYRPRILPLAAACLVLVVIDWFFAWPLGFSGGWAAGAFFWLAGLYLSWNKAKATRRTVTSVVSLLLLAYATNHLWPGVVLLNGFGFPYRGNDALQLSDLLLLPVALSLFCSVMDLGFPGQKIVRWMAIAIPVGMVAILRLMGRLWENVPWTMAGGATIAAVLLLAFNQERWGSAFFAFFRPLGKISYAIYLFHVPIAAFISALYPWGTSWANYLGAFALWVGLTVGAAWVAEMWIQPRLAAAYRRRMARRA